MDGGCARMRGLPKASAVFFDLGNTLAGGSDTPEAFKASVRAVVRRLSELGVEVDPRRLAEVRLRNRAFFNDLRRSTLREVLGVEWMRKDLEDVGVQVTPELVEEALKAHLDAVVSLRFVYPDVPECLERLKSLGYPMAVVSNVSDHRMAEETLNKLGFSRYFKTLVTSAEVGWRKPHPAIFAEALRRLEVKPSEAVFVGDDPWADVHGARSAGMAAVLIRRKPVDGGLPTAPDVVLSSLRELPDLLIEGA